MIFQVDIFQQVDQMLVPDHCTSCGGDDHKSGGHPLVLNIDVTGVCTCGTDITVTVSGTVTEGQFAIEGMTSCVGCSEVHVVQYTGIAAPAPEITAIVAVHDDDSENKYAILSDEERAKGFVRPLRRSYKHVGARPSHPTRELTSAEHERYDQFGYVQFEPYPCAVVVDPGGPTPVCGYPIDDERHVEGASFLHRFANADGSSVTGRYWTAAQLASGCGEVTTMAEQLAETYARKPGFYGGTFCVGCRKAPAGCEAGEFVWIDDGTSVGT